MKISDQESSKNGTRLKRMYEILISNDAEKYYKKQVKDIKRRINTSIDVVSKNPYFNPHIKKLHGPLEGKYRISAGSIRIVYTINEKNKTVEIIAIGKRGDIYKK